MYDNLTRTNLEFAYRKAEKRIEELEKENAELKEKLEGAEFGYHEGFKDCAKSRLNVTTISDCPIKDVQELQKKLAGSKMENDCKFAFNGLATFVDWYAVNKEQKERYMNDILLLVNKMEKLPKEIE